jgi:hypothetical protein
MLGLVQAICVQAQEAIPATGGNVSGSGGSLSYTIGQVVYTTNTGTNGSVAEGVQQPYEISVVVGIEQANDINFICTAYPNPTTDLLILEVEGTANEKFIFQLYDIMGKLLVSKKIIDNKTTISMANLAPAIYFLKVTDHQKVVKTFKIIKNQ